MEDPRNIGAICSQCSEARLQSWQQHHEHVVVRKGDYVKVRVKNEGGEEWMWVEITNVIAEPMGNGFVTGYNGLWKNDAVMGNWPRYGTPAIFLRTDIADYCEQGDFDNWRPWHNPTDDTPHHYHQI